MTAPSTARAARPGALSCLISALRCLPGRMQRRRQLASLLKLDGHLLRDIGLTEQDIRDMRRHW